MAASRSWNIFHIDLETAFFQGQSHGVNRDVVCQLQPEAGHPPCVARRLKKHVYGMSDAPTTLVETLWTRHFVVMVWFPRELTDVNMCCTQPKRESKIGTKRALHRDMARMTSHLHRVRDQKEMQHLRKCWIPLKEAQLQAKSVAGIINLFVDHLFGTCGIEME